MSHSPSLGTHPGFNKLSFLLTHHEDHGASEQRGVREADLGALCLCQVVRGAFEGARHCSGLEAARATSGIDYFNKCSLEEGKIGARQNLGLV